MKNSFPSVILSESSRVILSVAKNLAMLSIAAVMFVACGGDNGSSANDDEIDSSSSSAIQSSSSDVKYSSSAKESSSSSEARSSSSSVKESSSSVKVSSSSGAKSSSSVVKSSSSSVKASSSSGNSKFDFEWNSMNDWVEDCDETNDGKIGIALYRSDKAEFLCAYNETKKKWEWVKIGGISSSSAKSSSSSVKVSSSSVYVPFDHSRALASETYIDRSRYKQFTDSRNGRSYYYITIVGKDTNNVKATVTIMAENLNIGKDVAGVDDQNDDSVIERYCYKDDTTYCDEYGGLYQWAEMMQLPSRCNTESCANLIQENHQGICPDGWRLMNENDFAIVAKSEDNTDGLKGLRSSRFQGSNASGFSLIAAGKRSVFSDTFMHINGTAYWYFPKEDESEVDWAYVGYVASASVYSTGSIDKKRNGFSVRCVKQETEE